MNEFWSFPIHTQIVICLVIGFSALWFVRGVFNLLAYVWAVLAMPKEERIAYMTQKRLIPFMRSGK